MKMQKRTYRCLLCGWEGTPIEIWSKVYDDERLYKVCPECFRKGLPIETLVLHLDILPLDEDVNPFQ